MWDTTQYIRVSQLISVSSILRLTGTARDARGGGYCVAVPDWTLDAADGARWNRTVRLPLAHDCSRTLKLGWA